MHATARTLALFATLLACAFAPRPAPAQPIATATPRGHWNPRFRRVGAPEYVWGGAAVTGLALEAALLQPHPPPLRWNAPILFDEAARELLRYRTTAMHDAAATSGWIAMIGLMAYPVAVDVPVAWLRGGSSLAWQFVWQDAVVMATAGAVDLALRDTTGRARPYTSDCLAAGRQDCANDDEWSRSFPGGHMAVSTAATALLCAQHLYTHLYGGAGDGLACGVAIALDAGVGVSRIVADVHWTSDIIAGSLLGGLIGWGVPTLMWYGFGRGTPFGPRAEPAARTHRRPSGTVVVAPTAQLGPGGGTAGAMGMF